MDRQPVQSSMIRSVGFENGVMHVEFTNGKVYAYTGPKVEEHHKAMMAAPSIGGHFGKYVRNCPHTTCAPVT